jgi:hypothetical protein
VWWKSRFRQLKSEGKYVLLITGLQNSYLNVSDDGAVSLRSIPPIEASLIDRTQQIRFAWWRGNSHPSKCCDYKT